VRQGILKKNTLFSLGGDTWTGETSSNDFTMGGFPEKGRFVTAMKPDQRKATDSTPSSIPRRSSNLTRKNTGKENKNSLGKKGLEVFFGTHVEKKKPPGFFGGENGGVKFYN